MKQRDGLTLVSACVRALPVLALTQSLFLLALPARARTRLIWGVRCRPCNSLPIRSMRASASWRAQFSKTSSCSACCKEVETLKAEVAKMRGQAEVQVHQLDTLGKRQNDLYVDLDQRITDLAKTAKPAPVAEVAPPAASGSPASPAPAAAPATPAVATSRGCATTRPAG